MTDLAGRRLRLRIIGDWGDANLHRVAGWMSYELIARTHPETRTSILSGVGGFDAVRAVGRREVDIGLATPATYLKMAVEGLGPFKSERFTDLRGLAVIPQDDRLICGIRPDFGALSLGEIASRQLPARLAVSPDDGRSHFGHATHRTLAAHGIDPDALRSWGGDLVYRERPDLCLDAVLSGAADGIIHEAIMMPAWRELLTRNAIRLVPFASTALKMLAQEGLPSATLAPDYFGLEDSLPCLEFSDFLVFTRADLPDEIAELLTRAMVETRANFERIFRHIPAKNSPVTWPLEPAAMAKTSIPLHRGAERYYQQAGLL